MCVKKYFFFPLSLALLIGPSIYGAYTSSHWIDCWRSAVELSKNRNDYSEALNAYTAAIKAQENSEAGEHLYLYIERAKLCLKMKEWNRAIQDFSLILHDKNSTQEEIIDALWGRGQAYLASGKTEAFESDRKRLEALEPFVKSLDDSQEYQILKMGNHVSREPHSQERLLNVLIKQKKIKNKEDVTFTPSGLVIVRKAK